MKRLCLVTFVLLHPIFSAHVHAQSPVSTPEAPKMVVLGFNAAVLQTADAKRDLTALQTKFAPRQAHLQTLNQEVEALRAALANAAAPPSDADRSAKQQSLNAKERQLQREAEDFKNESDEASQQALQLVAQKLYGFVQEYARQHNYTLVLERGSDAAPVVWYAANNLDITVPVIKAYDAKGSAALPAGPSPH